MEGRKPAGRCVEQDVQGAVTVVIYLVCVGIALTWLSEWAYGGGFHELGGRRVSQEAESGVSLN